MEHLSSFKAVSVQVATAAPEAKQQARQQLLAVLDNIYKIVKTPLPVDDFLAALELPQETFAFATLLAVKAQTVGSQSQLFIQQATKLITQGSEDDVRANAEAFKTICHVFSEVYVASDMPGAAILPLEAAIKKLGPTPDHLTPIHADFVKVCLLSHHYKAALRVLDYDLFEIEPQANALDPKDSLLYFYYGGMVYTGLKQFTKAFDFFLVALTSPAQVLSAIVVEAYKKFCLVSILVHGQIAALPKYTSASVSRSVEKLCGPYTELGKAFVTFKQDDVDKVLSKYRAEYEKDHNLGLAQQVVESLTRRHIQRLTQTFVTLSLADIAKAASLSSPKQAEEYILRMIENNEIYATLNQTNGMASFHGAPEAYDSNATVRLLDEHIHQAISLGDRVSLLDRRVAISEDYLKRVLAQDRPDGKAFDGDDLDLPTSERMAGGMRLQ